MNNKEIHNKILSEIEEYFGLRVSEKNFYNGYYIFDLGENSVCHFKIKGLKRWLFGIWLHKDDDNITKVELFGENTDHINKFKPTQTEINDYGFKRDFDNYSAEEDNGHSGYEIFRFAKTIRMIQKNPLIYRYHYYGNLFMDVGFVRFAAKELYEYCIWLPSHRFAENRLIPMWLHIIKAIYTMRFKRKRNNFHVNIVKREDGLYPQYLFNMVYDGCNEDETERIYSTIMRNRKYRQYGDSKAQIRERAWLAPFCVWYNCRFIHCEDDNDKRGFHLEEANDSSRNKE